jgi:GAF domain-containing protein
MCCPVTSSSLNDQANIRVSMDGGIIPKVVTGGDAVNLTDAYESPDFNQSLDRKTGYRTKAMLCIPIKSDNDVVGAIQLINKSVGSFAFSRDDQESLTLFMQAVAQTIVRSTMYQSIQGRGKAKPRGADNLADAYDPLEK